MSVNSESLPRPRPCGRNRGLPATLNHNILSRQHNDGANVLYFDGHVKWEQ